MEGQDNQVYQKQKKMLQTINEMTADKQLMK